MEDLQIWERLPDVDAHCGERRGAEVARVVLRPELTHPGPGQLGGLAHAADSHALCRRLPRLVLEPRHGRRVVEAGAVEGEGHGERAVLDGPVHVGVSERHRGGDVEGDGGVRGSMGASANRCSTASSAVALGGNTTPKASTRTVMRLGFFGSEQERKNKDRERVCIGGEGESVRIGRQRDSMAYRTVQIAERQNMSEAAYPLPP
jgi:hypothetical protein